MADIGLRLEMIGIPCNTAFIKNMMFEMRVN